MRVARLSYGVCGVSRFELLFPLGIVVPSAVELRGMFLTCRLMISPNAMLSRCTQILRVCLLL